MDISGIISISGRPGLSKIVKQSRNGIIVESLVDGKRFPVQGTERISSLEDTSIYTYEDDILLADVFQRIYDFSNGDKTISHKSSAEDLKKQFSQILPNYDEDRVYNSDIKKVFQWYNLLIEKGLLKKEVKEKKEEKSPNQKEKKKTTKGADNSEKVKKKKDEESSKKKGTK